jgi:mono/diheme cytochrome c family protein
MPAAGRLGRPLHSASGNKNVEKETCMKFRLIALILFIFMALAACSLAEDIPPPPGYRSPTPPPSVGPLYPSQPPSPARGAGIYTAKCLPCHGESGLGNGPMASQMPVAVPAIGLREISSQSAPAAWFTLLSQGRLERGMPPFLSLSEHERWDVLSYVYSLSATSEQLQDGASSYRIHCLACHGAQGGGDGPQAAGLNPAPTAFTNLQYMSQATGIGLYRAIAEGVSPSMAAFGNKLSEGEMWALVAYLRSLAFDPSALAATPEASPTPNLPAATASRTRSVGWLITYTAGPSSPAGSVSGLAP